MRHFSDAAIVSLVLASSVGAVLRAGIVASAAGRDPMPRSWPSGSCEPPHPFLDVWVKNVPNSGCSFLPPQPGHL